MELIVFSEEFAEEGAVGLVAEDVRSVVKGDGVFASGGEVEVTRNDGQGLRGRWQGVAKFAQVVVKNIGGPSREEVEVGDGERPLRRLHVSCEDAPFSDT